jgi:hypothetical protein
MATYKLGFKQLAKLIPDIVGEPKEDEWHDGTSGDGLQRTSNGLMVWRKADNFTAFTNGYWTWINGPYGLQDRHNDDRFPWELHPRYEVRNIINELPIAPRNQLDTRSISSIEYIVVHWDGGSYPIPESYDPAAYYRMEAFYHINKDWSWAEPGLQGGYGLMYHEKISRDGTVWLTRPICHVCWAAMNANRTGYQICVDCTVGQPPTEDQLKSLKSRLDQLCKQLEVPNSQVWGHGEMTWLGNATECPGHDLLSLVKEYRG